MLVYLHIVLYKDVIGKPRRTYNNNKNNLIHKVPVCRGTEVALETITWCQKLHEDSEITR